MSEESRYGFLSRRQFVGTAATTVAGLTLMPGRVFGGETMAAPSDRLNIAGVGVGGYGRTNLENMASENIVALCDMDWRYAKGCFEDYPNAPGARLLALPGLGGRYNENPRREQTGEYPPKPPERQ